MSDFQTVVTAEDAAPDLSKHVNYVQGMVLGVADFNQEFAFLNGRVQWLAREAIGYGTLSGLHVGVEPTGNGPQVRVAAGVALTPRGELVCVPEDQCALIDDWLAQNQAVLPAGLDQIVYVQLCYKICATDDLPIPGEPCRDEDELMAPSRIADDFRLELTTTPPDQREEDLVRAFAAWLRNVRLTNDPYIATPESDFAQAVRDAWEHGGELSAMPPDTLFIPTERQSDYLRLALQIWTTLVRPHARAEGSHCATPPNEGCIMLAALDVHLADNRLKSAGDLTVRDERAPFLLHLRMLQEWLIAGRQDVLPSDTVLAETLYGLAPDAGVSEEYSRADHTHGTPLPPELLGDVESSPAPPDSIPSIPDAPDHQLWTTVVAIQGTPVAPEPPTEAGQPLVFDGTAWHPGSVPIALEPGETVVTERSYGQGESAGESAGESLQYARASHTHGTPPPPVLVGEVTVVSAAETDTGYEINTRVARIYDKPVGLPDGAPAAAEGQVLKLIDAGADGLVWRPADDSAGAGGPAAGTTVVDERTYGLPSDVGNPPAGGDPLQYAPATHTHGTPPAPTFIGEIGIVATQSTDTLQQYDMRVAKILTHPVAATPTPAPDAGDVLTLVGSPGKLEWQIGKPSAGGSFVVAAGQFRADGTTLFEHNGLQATWLDPALPTAYLLNFTGFLPENRYVVTGTPWAFLRASNPHVFEYIGRLREVLEGQDLPPDIRDRLKAQLPADANGLVIRVQQLRFKMAGSSVSSLEFVPADQGFMVEVSQY